MYVSLSHNSSHIFSANQNFLTKLQQLQKNQIKDINLLIKPQQEEIVSTMRQALKIAEDVPMVLDYIKNRINQLLADVTSMIRTSRKIQTSGISFPCTGISKKRV